MYLITDTQFKNFYSSKTKMDAYNIFTSMSVIKACITDLVLKGKNAHENLFHLPRKLL